MLVYVHGTDGVGWSIDSDRMALIKAIKSLGHKTTNNILESDVIYSVWADSFISSKKMMIASKLLKKPVIANITNNITQEKINRYKKTINTWVVANSSQSQKLSANGVKKNKIKTIRYYVDENQFRPLKTPKEQLCLELKVPTSVLNKKIIAHFQRDSEGNNLALPKKQKNPDLLIDILRKLPKSEYIVLLGGPRRHYIISQLLKMGIDFHFLGDEKYHNESLDDISYNKLPPSEINKAYNLSDISIVNSSSEGGPKAIKECLFSCTPVISTPVGWVPDILPPKYIFTESREAIHLIQNDSTYDYNSIIEVRDRLINDDSFEGFAKKIGELFNEYD